MNSVPGNGTKETTDETAQEAGTGAQGSDHPPKAGPHGQELWLSLGGAMRDRHPLAGQTVTITKGQHAGSEYRIEDWWQNVGGGSWMFAKGNPACMVYAMRSVFEDLPTDDEVVYGKIGCFGHLIHVSEFDEAAMVGRN